MNKSEVLSAIAVIIDEKVKAAHDAMQAAQESANGEGKSSAGDKYETARAMGQIDRDMFARQYEQALSERKVLDRIVESNKHSNVGLGSLVKTTAGFFFIAVSVGKIVVDGENVMAVSLASPIGQLLKGKKEGESFLFLGKQVLLQEIS